MFIDAYVEWPGCFTNVVTATVTVILVHYTVKAINFFGFSESVKDRFHMFTNSHFPRAIFKSEKEGLN